MGYVEVPSERKTDFVYCIFHFTPGENPPEHNDPLRCLRIPFCFTVRFLTRPFFPMCERVSAAVHNLTFNDRVSKPPYVTPVRTRFCNMPVVSVCHHIHSSCSNSMSCSLVHCLLHLRIMPEKHVTLLSDLNRIKARRNVRRTAITALSSTFQHKQSYEILDAYGVKFTLEQATKAPKGNRGIALLFF